MNATEALRSMKLESSGETVALLIANALLESDRQPYCFSINHDIRPPKNLACPVTYDWSLRGHVGIETWGRFTAREWIINALLKGYSVAKVHPKQRIVEGLSYSIETVRARAEFYQRPKAESTHDDDDIPF